MTIASRPSGETGWRGLVEMICPTGKAKNFSEWDWTAKIRLNGFNKFDFWRKRGSENFVTLNVSTLPSTAPSSGLLVEAAPEMAGYIPATATREMAHAKIHPF